MFPTQNSLPHFSLSLSPSLPHPLFLFKLVFFSATRFAAVLTQKTLLTPFDMRSIFSSAVNVSIFNEQKSEQSERDTK